MDAVFDRAVFELAKICIPCFHDDNNDEDDSEELWVKNKDSLFQFDFMMGKKEKKENYCLLNLIF